MNRRLPAGMDPLSTEASAWRLRSVLDGEPDAASVRVRAGDLRWLLAEAGLEAPDAPGRQ